MIEVHISIASFRFNGRNIYVQQGAGTAHTARGWINFR